MRYYLTIKHIKNRWWIELRGTDVYLRDIGCPFAVGCGSCKIPSCDIGRDFTDLALIRTILNLAYLAFESHLNHEALYRLVIHEVFPVPHFSSYAPIAISTFMLMENILDSLFLCGIFVFGLKTLKVVISPVLPLDFSVVVLVGEVHTATGSL